VSRKSRNVLASTNVFAAISRAYIEFGEGKASSQWLYVCTATYIFCSEAECFEQQCAHFGCVVEAVHAMRYHSFVFVASNSHQHINTVINKVTQSSTQGHQHAHDSSLTRQTRRRLYRCALIERSSSHSQAFWLAYIHLLCVCSQFRTSGLSSGRLLTIEHGRETPGNPPLVQLSNGLLVYDGILTGTDITIPQVSLSVGLVN
jgi:hypothetical protein